MLGHDMHAVLMPIALDVQPVGIAAAAAVAHAVGCGAVLQGGVELGHVIGSGVSVNSQS
ncbi:hypothetical protein D3C79_1112140 [compost metagenome]